MSILAIELSSMKKSVALRLDGGAVHERSWTEDRSHPDPLYQQLEALRLEADVKWDALTAVVVGRGPGQYSGMRASASAAFGFALPGGIPVHGVSSGEALAWRVLSEGAHEVVAVLGDARRDRWWMGCFSLENKSFSSISGWSLLTDEDMVSTLRSAQAYAVTSDWDRRSDSLSTLLNGDQEILPQGRFPSAKDLLDLYMNRVDAGVEQDSPLPIYLHPAVSPPTPKAS